MRIRAIKRYSDILLNRIVEKGEELTVSDSRGKHLEKQHMAEILSEKEAKEPAKQ